MHPITRMAVFPSQQFVGTCQHRGPPRPVHRRRALLVQPGRQQNDGRTVRGEQRDPGALEARSVPVDLATTRRSATGIRAVAPRPAPASRNRSTTAASSGPDASTPRPQRSRSRGVTTAWHAPLCRRTEPDAFPSPTSPGHHAGPPAGERVRVDLHRGRPAASRSSAARSRRRSGRPRRSGRLYRSAVLGSGQPERFRDQRLERCLQAAGPGPEFLHTSDPSSMKPRSLKSAPSGATGSAVAARRNAPPAARTPGDVGPLETFPDSPARCRNSSSRSLSSVTRPAETRAISIVVVPTILVKD